VYISGTVCTSIATGKPDFKQPYLSSALWSGETGLGHVTETRQRRLIDLSGPTGGQNTQTLVLGPIMHQNTF